MATLSLKNLKAVSTMMRNCLLKNRPTLKNIDFNHLEAVVRLANPDDMLLPVTLRVKRESESRYRFEQNHEYQFSRVSTADALADLGLTTLTYQKNEYNEVAEALSALGTLTIVSGEINNEFYDALVEFRFGTREDAITTKVVNLGGDTAIKSEYNDIFHTPVTLTFKGREVEPEPTVPQEELKDIAPLFINRSIQI